MCCRYVDSEALTQVIRDISGALQLVEDELYVLGRHELIIATPGAPDVLTTDREFKVSERLYDTHAHQTDSLGASSHCLTSYRHVSLCSAMRGAQHRQA